MADDLTWTVRHALLHPAPGATLDATAVVKDLRSERIVASVGRPTTDRPGPLQCWFAVVRSDGEPWQVAIAPQGAREAAPGPRLEEVAHSLARRWNASFVSDDLGVGPTPVPVQVPRPRPDVLAIPSTARPTLPRGSGVHAVSTVSDGWRVVTFEPDHEPIHPLAVASLLDGYPAILLRHARDGRRSVCVLSGSDAPVVPLTRLDTPVTTSQVWLPRYLGDALQVPYYLETAPSRQLDRSRILPDLSLEHLVHVLRAPDGPMWSRGVLEALHGPALMADVHEGRTAPDETWTSLEPARRGWWPRRR